MIIIILMALTNELNQSLINTAENISNLRLVKIQIKITSNNIELTLHTLFNVKLWKICQNDNCKLYGIRNRKRISRIG